GAGVGAYVALLIAGARPDLVPAALLLPGRGLAGGGAVPEFARPVLAADADLLTGLGEEMCSNDVTDPFDPLVASCMRDIRPVDYASDLADSARRLLVADGGAASEAAWLRAVGERPSAMAAPREIAHALEALARLA